MTASSLAIIPSPRPHMNTWWEAAQDLDACFHDNKDWAALWTLKHALWLHDMLWIMRGATLQKLCLILTLFLLWLWLEGKVRRLALYSCARCIWLCVVLSFCVYSCNASLWWMAWGRWMFMCVSMAKALFFSCTQCFSLMRGLNPCVWSLSLL